MKKIDLLFIDHLKSLYLWDFKIIEGEGLIKEGSLIVADNIIYPGCPDYLNYFKESNEYRNTIYNSYLEYTTDPDAILASIKL